MYTTEGPILCCVACQPGEPSQRRNLRSISVSCIYTPKLTAQDTVPWTHALAECWPGSCAKLLLRFLSNLWQPIRFPQLHYARYPWDNQSLQWSLSATQPAEIALTDVVAVGDRFK
jgi:hypothetical protein